MNDRVRAIIEEARKLSPQERVELVDLLEAEFAGEESEGAPEEIEAAWLEEVERRVAAAERGETTFVDAEEVLARMRQLIR
jgi:putative addiction module component (TIGR02574 family)